MSWKMERNRQERATRLAEDLVSDLGLSTPPIDPLAIAAGEKPLLVAKGGDVGELFDGQLEYHGSKNRFVLLFNTKYDRGASEHHPRTRFSIGHELGHFYLPEHRSYLEGGGEWHGSRSEFRADAGIEREADAFAAGLLLPRQLLMARVRGRELTLRLLDQIVESFETSRVATAWRCVDVTDQPCALFAIRDGRVAWRQVSEMAIKAGCYPSQDRHLRSDGARDAWGAFERGSAQEAEKETLLGSWFETYERRDLDEVVVTEQFIPVPVMKTLLILITMDESDVFPE